MPKDFHQKVINSHAVSGFDSSWFRNVLKCFRTSWTFRTKDAALLSAISSPNPFAESLDGRRAASPAVKSIPDPHPRSSPRSFHCPYTCLPEALSGVASPQGSLIMHRQTLQTAQTMQPYVG